VQRWISRSIFPDGVFGDTIPCVLKMSRCVKWGLLVLLLVMLPV